MKALLLFIYLLTLLPITASASTPEAIEQVRLGELHGLKALFVRLQKPIEAPFGNNTLAHTLLGSREAYRNYADSLSAAERQQLQLKYAQSLSYWQQFQVVAARVLGGDNEWSLPSYSLAYDAFSDDAKITVTVSPGFKERDSFVSRMDMLGYTPQEITDVISGRLTLHALQQSGRMHALGYSEERVSAYLDQQYTSVLRYGDHDRRPQLAAYRYDAQQANSLPEGLSERKRLEHHVEQCARRYGIDPRLIRAIIQNESSWQVQAHSAVGAIGLMQLMPATAQMLGVDPLIPEQNIEGGIRYLAGLLELFNGDLDAALVSYNAGPSHARKWRKGGTVLYGETRKYLARIKNSYARLDS